MEAGMGEQTEGGRAVNGQIVCGCGHRVADHDPDRCREWWRYPDVMRPCGCNGVWKPGPEDSRYDRWVEQERAAQVALGGG